MFSHLSLRAFTVACPLNVAGVPRRLSTNRLPRDPSARVDNCAVNFSLRSSWIIRPRFCEDRAAWKAVQRRHVTDNSSSQTVCLYGFTSHLPRCPEPKLTRPETTSTRSSESERVDADKYVWSSSRCCVLLSFTDNRRPAGGVGRVSERR